MAKEKDMYFDNTKIEILIAEYKNIEENFKKQRLLKEIMTDVKEIVKRIINCYNFSRFEEREDLEQHAMEACFKSIKSFNPLHPKYSSAFNWFSLTAKRALLNYTIRRRKHRGHLNIDDYFTIEHSNNELTNHFLEDYFQEKLIDIIDRNFLQKERENYINLTYILTGFLVKTKKFKKNDFYSWARSCGYNTVICRAYIKDIGAHINDIRREFSDTNN